jgi:hypothetical protein
MYNKSSSLIDIGTAILEMFQEAIQDDLTNTAAGIKYSLADGRRLLACNPLANFLEIFASPPK